MNSKNSILCAGFGLWVSGLLVGANLVEFLPGEPSWPPIVILAIGMITTITTAHALYRNARQSPSSN